MASEYASQALIPADTSPGSGMLSFLNAKALAAMGLQGQINYVNSIARLASIGPNPIDATLPNPDIDSYINPFNVYRLEAQPASGQVLFSVAYAPQQNILIPAVAAGSTGGVIVQTNATVGGVQFQVVADPTNVAYNATDQGYYLLANTTSVSVTVQCLNSGVQGNVAANQITQLFSGPGTTSLAGFATVTNPSAFTNASALETDTAVKARFPLVISTGTVATSNALAAAVLAITLNLTYSIGDSLNPSGGSAPGTFTVVVNNSGTNTTPSTNLIAQVLAVMNTTRAAGISCQVIAPTLVPCNLIANIQVSQGYQSAAVITACANAFTALANNVGLDPQGNPTSLKIAAVYATLYTTPGVRDVTSLTLNAGTVDVVATFGRQIVAGNCTLSPYS
jgi:hypothetical protein